MLPECFRCFRDPIQCAQYFKGKITTQLWPEIEALGLSNHTSVYDKHSNISNGLAIKSTRVHILKLCPRPKNTMKEIAASVSHFSAIREAVLDHALGSSGEYSVIMEDDMKFIFDIDFDQVPFNAIYILFLVLFIIFHVHYSHS
jgi:hypothetical protein